MGVWVMLNRADSDSHYCVCSSLSHRLDFDPATCFTILHARQHMSPTSSTVSGWNMIDLTYASHNLTDMSKPTNNLV